jgi:predicted DNA-binding transcriptional regulator AlpA
MDRITLSNPKRLVRISEAMARVPYKPTQFYALIKQGKLPRIIKPEGGRAAFMDEDELNEAIERMIAARDASG